MVIESGQYDDVLRSPLFKGRKQAAKDLIVTTAIGLKCPCGVMLVADTQETRLDGSKKRVPKISSC
jgi:20S proteasome alpha/beta subunit